MMKKKAFARIKKQQSACIMILFAMLLLCSVRVYAAEFPDKITLNKTSVSDYYGKAFTLKATVYPENAENQTVTWTSSNTAVATVSEKGKVKLTGSGTAKITAATADGKTAVCKVKCDMYRFTKDKKYVSVGSASGKVRKYRAYSQEEYEKYNLYYPYHGCVTTAVAIAGSGFGKTYTPVDIHQGKANKPYSERRAVKKMGASAALWGKAPISMRVASHILKDTKVKNKERYTFSRSKAEKEIRRHLRAGKPVIVKANNKTHKGIRLANGHHAIVLVGIDAKDRITFIDTYTGRMNYAHSSKNYAKSMKLSTLIKYHMDQAKGNVNFPYAISTANSGGYMLVG